MPMNKKESLEATPPVPELIKAETINGVRHVEYR